MIIQKMRDLRLLQTRFLISGSFLSSTMFFSSVTAGSLTMQVQSSPTNGTLD